MFVFLATPIPIASSVELREKQKLVDLASTLEPLLVILELKI